MYLRYMAQATSSLPKFAAVPEAGENPAFLQSQLISYLGNKRTLLPFIGLAIRQVQARLGVKRLRILDLFSGTGVVARYLKRYSSELHVNDLETYSRITNECYLTNYSTVSRQRLEEGLAWLEAELERKAKPGLLCELYAPKNEAAITPEDRVFYTRRNAIYLDTARAEISLLPTELQPYFLAPLIAEASVHVNTSGIFKGFYKNTVGVGQFGGTGRNALRRILGEIKLSLPLFSNFETEYQIHQQDANALVGVLPEFDLAYFDPPYNQHPYGSNYFMLNLLAEYQRPQEMSKVSGIPAAWNRSKYNQRAAAAETLFAAVEDCPAKFVLISYNSEGFILPGQFKASLGKLGQVTICEAPYNTFRGCRNLRNRPLHVTEFLYLLRKA